MAGYHLSIGKIIDTDADVAQGATWLAAQDPRLADALNATGSLPLRRRPDGFGALFSAIVSQQISTASAAAIWARLVAAGMDDPDTVARSTADDLRALGLTRQKTRYALELARAEIDFVALRRAPDAQVIATLTAVPGIGTWTAEIYAMFSLGRADAFAAGDLALQEAARMLYNLPERPTEKILRNMARNWSPWRSVAARLLFAYYRVAKQRDGIR